MDETRWSLLLSKFPSPTTQNNSEANSSLISPCHLQALQATGSHGVVPANSSRAVSTHTSSREIPLLTQSENVTLEFSYRAFFNS